MKTTYKSIMEAAAAMAPLMSVKGLSGRTQIMMMRLWGELCANVKLAEDADAALVRGRGTVRPDGNIDFVSDAHKAEFLAQRDEMLRTEAEVHPITIKPEEAIFAVSTPSVWAALDGYINIEEE